MACLCVYGRSAALAVGAHGLRYYTLSMLVCVWLRKSGAGAGGNRTRRMLAMLNVGE